MKLGKVSADKLLVTEKGIPPVPTYYSEKLSMKN